MRHALILFLFLLFLSACEDDTVKAERHFENALALLGDGDEARAMVELRNVFLHDGFHKEARALFASLLYDQGEWRQAYSQYLRLIEHYPDEVDVRRRLANMALDFGDLAEVKKHGSAAMDLAPHVPDHKALGLVIAYHEADAARDLVQAAKIAMSAKDLLEDHPDTDIALRLVAHWYAQGPDPARAVPYLDQLIAAYPASVSLHLSRLRALDAVGDDDAVLQHMREMLGLFPEDEGVAQLLLNWYASRDDLEGIEAVLRRRAGADDAAPEGHLTLVSFLAEAKGIDVAMAEVLRLIAANDGTDLGRRYQLRLAHLRLETGDGMSEQDLRTLARETRDDDLRNLSLHIIARLHMKQGESDRAMKIVEQILARDKSHVQALILRAARRIEEGSVHDAITDLRSALDQTPENTDALILLAEAHQNLGNLALAEQRLAQAFQVSNSAPEVAQLFARFQLAHGKTRAAARVLADAVQRNIDDPALVALYGQVLVTLDDTATARALIARLEERGTTASKALARDVKAAVLFRDNRVDESLEVLSTSMREQGIAPSPLVTEVRLLRMRMLSGRFEAARAQIADLKQRFPHSIALRIVQANLSALEGQGEAAIEGFRQILRDHPGQIIALQRLYALLRAQGQEEEARALLAEALTAAPERYELLRLRAYELEQAGDVDGALDIFAELYARNPADIIVSNNYASLLAYFRDDAASLDIASHVADKLEGTQVPAFLDTLGYVRLRKGQYRQAIFAFEAAARGWSDNATIAFNLGEAYAMAGRLADARAELERGFRLAKDNTQIHKYARALDVYQHVSDKAQN
ncbi:MAG: tetratricopeptide repeat protein [Pseudomonadota bacterium]